MEPPPFWRGFPRHRRLRSSACCHGLLPLQRRRRPSNAACGPPAATRPADSTGTIRSTCRGRGETRTAG